MSTDPKSQNPRDMNDIPEEALERAQQEYQEAHDFDPKDPLFGLTKEQLSGPKMGRRSVLRLMAAAGMLSMTNVLVGCAAPSGGGAEGSSETAAEPAAGSGGGEIVAGWGGTAEITTLDPAQIGQVLQFQVTSNVLSGLMHITPQLIAEGDLAESWEPSDDGLEWTFTLKSGVTWHDGEPFTADDVVYTFNRSKDPDQSVHSSVLANVTTIEKIDDLTIKFIMDQPQASFLVKTLERSSGRAMTIVSQKAIDEMGLEQYALTPVGTGPFKVTSHELGQSLVLEKNENYYDPERPKLDKITIIPIPEPEPLAAAIEAGDIHLIGGNGASPELIDRFDANPDIVVSTVDGPGFQYLSMNPHIDPFKVEDYSLSVDELMEQDGFKVRLAIAKAFDREDFIKRALFGRGAVGYGSVNPAMKFFFDTEINSVSNQAFDLDAAKQLLADAGFPDGEGLPTLKLLTTPGGKREGEIIIDMMKKNIGLNIELDINDFTVLIERSRAMDYELMRLGSGGDYDPDDALVDFMMSDSKFNGPTRPDDMPFGYFADPEVDEIVQAQRVESDLEKRKELVQQANMITSDKVAFCFTHHPVFNFIFRTDINYPDESRIPGLFDMDRITLA